MVTNIMDVTRTFSSWAAFPSLSLTSIVSSRAAIDDDLFMLEVEGVKLSILGKGLVGDDCEKNG